MNNQIIRTSVRTLYDMQKLRIQNGNRIAAAFRVKLGLESSQAETENQDAHAILNELRSEFKRITDGVKRITKNIKIDSPLITTRDYNRGPHNLKHTFGRRLRNAGVPLETRKALLHHNDGDITTHYSPAEIAELLAAVEKIVDIKTGNILRRAS